MFTLILREIRPLPVNVSNHGIELTDTFIPSAQIRRLPTPDNPVTPPYEAFEHFTHNFDNLDPEKIQRVIAILLEAPKKRRSDAGKPKPRPATQPQLPGAA